MTRSVFRTPQPQRLSVAVLAVLCALAPAAFAETAADPTNLDKVVVKGERAEGYSVRRTSAGTRFDLAPREIPQSISIISHQRIEDQNLDDIIDVLANTTGVKHPVRQRTHRVLRARFLHRCLPVRWPTDADGAELELR